MEKVEQILNLLKGEEEKNQKEILLECVEKIGTKEWTDAIKDLWKRMEKLEKKEIQ